MLPGSVANVKDGDRVLWLLSAPELVPVVGVRPGKLGGLMICRLSSEQLAERFEEDALVSFRGVLSASLSASVSPRSFISSSEPSESLSRLLSDSAGDSGVTERNRETKMIP